MKETIKPSKSTKTSGANALPSNRKEQIIDNLTNANLETISKALADKDKAISDLETKIKQLEAQNKDLDYLLNSGRNKFEHERNKKLKKLVQKIADLEKQNQDCHICQKHSTTKVLQYISTPEHDCPEEDCICDDDCETCYHNCCELNCNCRNERDHE